PRGWRGRDRHRASRVDARGDPGRHVLRRRAVGRDPGRQAARVQGQADRGGHARLGRALRVDAVLRALSLSERELDRYSRQLVLPEWSGAAQERLKVATAIVIGAGALGSPAATYLAAAGVG